ncbi:MAG: flagellar basal body-associated FliL family protein [Gammaproteobacteria bacterium]
MVDEEENTPDQTKESGGMMKVILLVNAVLVLIGIAVGVTVFMMSGDDENATAQTDTEVLGGEEAEAVEPQRSGGTPIYIPLNPAFVVNFENQDLVSFLQVDIQVMTYDSSVEQALKTHMPVVRNELLLLLGGKQYHEINTREGKRKLSQEAIKEIRRVLDEAGAPSGIEALYFTSFVMQ